MPRGHSGRTEDATPGTPMPIPKTPTKAATAPLKPGVPDSAEYVPAAVVEDGDEDVLEPVQTASFGPGSVAAAPAAAVASGPASMATGGATFTSEELGCPPRKLAIALGSLGFFLACALVTFFVSRASLPANDTGMNDSNALTFISFNDLYELNPVANRGGLANFQALRSQHISALGAERVITWFAGDFLSPCAINSVDLDEAGANGLQGAVNGHHMVDMLSQVGIDVATLGNHEFDFDEATFRARMTACKFPIVASNLEPGTAGAAPFDNVARSHLFERAGVRFAVFSPITADNQPAYVKIGPFSSVAEQFRAFIAQLKADKTPWDVLVALSHLDMYQDEQLLAAVPEIDLIIGGHDHDNMIRTDAGSNGRARFITKADSNLATAYVHRVFIRPEELRAAAGTEFGSLAAAPAKAVRRHYRVTPELVTLDVTAFTPDATVQAGVDKWVNRAFSALEQDGMFPREVIASLPRPLDVTLTHVRTTASEAGAILAAAVFNAEETQLWADAAADAAGLAAARAARRARRPLSAGDAGVPPAQFGLANAGCLRLEGKLAAGVPLTVYDAMRVVPFGGAVLRVNATGAVISRALDIAAASAGSGAWMAYDPEVISQVDAPAAATAPQAGDKSAAAAAATGKVWALRGEPFVADAVYTFNLNDYLRRPSQIFGDGDLVDAAEAPIATHIQLAYAAELKRRFPATTV